MKQTAALVPSAKSRRQVKGSSPSGLPVGVAHSKLRQTSPDFQCREQPKANSQKPKANSHQLQLQRWIPESFFKVKHLIVLDLHAFLFQRTLHGGRRIEVMFAGEKP